MRSTCPRFLFVTLILGLTALTVTAQTSSQINYQGRLTDLGGTPVSDGTYSVAFQLYADSTGGASIWSETASVVATDGLFTHRLGSVTPLPNDLFAANESAWLQLSLNGEPVTGRVPLTGAPYARTAGDLRVVDSTGRTAFQTFSNSHRLSVYNEGGEERLRLDGALFADLVLYNLGGQPYISFHSGYEKDSAVQLPQASVSAYEISNEPGVATALDVDQHVLLLGVMTDLITIDVQIPDDGYIVVTGKCYVMLSGSTGPNTALIQIDEDEGGASSFPYFQQVGLSGYVNTGVNYFPVYVTRTYYKEKGGYTFRMEGRAQNVAPAVAATWDQILTATYYPSAYYANKAVVSDPAGHPEAAPIRSVDTLNQGRPGSAWEIDLGPGK